MKNLILSILIASTVLFSCSKTANTPATITTNSFPDLADIAVFHGNLTSNIVIVNTQGGPVTELHNESYKQLMVTAGATNVLHANVHQQQTKNPSQFTGNDITFNQAKQFDEQSVLSLKRVIDYFKAKGKKVYVLGISFGAFMTQELIADYGVGVADGFLIVVGRLDIDAGTWNPFSQGLYTQYIYDASGAFTINQLPRNESAEVRNMARLAAGLGFNRYTDRLKNMTDLSKVTYVYGNRDEQVGPLSTAEIQFLTGKGAKVVLESGGNHDKAINKSLSILKQTFNIP